MSPQNLKPIRFFLITASPDVAYFAWKNGVDRLFVDLEILGKDARQGHLNTVISRHTFADLAAVRQGVPEAELMARLNPINSNTVHEVEQAIACGTDVLMLPMFHTADEVATFATHVAGRARICLLAETIGAIENMAACVAVPGVSEVHIGLNDLHLERGDTFMFEPLADGTVDKATTLLRDADIPFGIGGIARASEGLLPAELILSDHVRLGSTGAILSRTFQRGLTTVDDIVREMDFTAEIGKLRTAYAHWQVADEQTLAENHQKIQAVVADIVHAISSKKTEA